MILVMAFFKLRAAPFTLIEDDRDKNTLPLLLELIPNGSTLHIFCYDQPIYQWKSVFRDSSNVKFHQEFVAENLSIYVERKTSIVIDSINQMVLLLGWSQCLKHIKDLQCHPNVQQLVIILHKDCLASSKMQTHLRHVANANVSYDTKDGRKISIEIKKMGKVSRSQHILSYDLSTKCLKESFVKNQKEDQQLQPEQVNPGNLSTFKIEVAQIEQMEKHKLQLPYMSQINYGGSKVYYEPDAVDDWDDEDPDDDLDI